MLDINCTIIIQMINFFIGFLMLKYLLFKPAAKHILEEENAEKSIKRKILGQKKLLEKKIEEKNQIWQKYEKYFKKNCPKKITSEQNKFEETQIEAQASEISNKEIEMIALHAQKILVERIGRAGK